MSFRRHGIATRLALMVLGGAGLVLVLVFLYQYETARNLITAQAEDSARNRAAALVGRIETVLHGVSKVAENTAAVLENDRPTPAEIGRLLHISVAKNTEIYGASAAFEPYAMDSGELYFAPYAYRDREGILLTHLGSDTYRYFAMDWYLIPRVLGQSGWSEPYKDDGGGGIVMATYSAPFYRGDGAVRHFTGVATADVSLTWLQRLVASQTLYRSGYAFLVTRTGTFLVHPNAELVMNDSIFSVAEERAFPWLREIGRKMVRGETGFLPFTSLTTGQDSYLFFAPLPSSGWSLGLVIPTDELFADAAKLWRDTLILAVLGLAALAGIALFMARSITKPLRGLAGAASAVAMGDLDAPLPAMGLNDEVGDLARSFGHMTAELKDYIRNLTETTAAKERIQSELMIARDIQLGILPKIFPAFPERREFDIFARIEPAREVGGDFYTFFFLDEHRFCFVIGDVSDKGVPAALFMAVTATLFKAKSGVEVSPGDTLARINDDLAAENDNAMFVTVFMGILDVRDGRLLWASGGHNPPVVLRRGAEPAMLPPSGNLMVGALPGMAFDTHELFLAPGDAVFTYTDGVTEAMDPDQAMFGEARLQQVMRQSGQGTPEEMVTDVMEEIERFGRGAVQSDDITMLAIRYNGPKGTSGKC